MDRARTATLTLPILALALAQLATGGCASEESGGGGPGPPPGGAHLDELAVLRNLGPQPNILAASASGRSVLVGDRQSPLLTIMDATDPAQRRSIFIAEATPTLGIAASPLGRELYLAAVETSSILVYDLATGLPAHAPLVVGQAANLVAASADGRFVLGTAFTAGLFKVFDRTFDFQPVGSTVVLDDQPAGLAVAHLGGPPRAYVVGLRRGKIFEIEFDPSRVAITDSLITEPGSSFIALSPLDERLAFVSTGDTLASSGDRVLIVDLQAGIVVGRVPVGRDPLGLDVSPDGRYVVVANSGSGSVSLIDVDRRAAIDELAVGGPLSAPTDVLFTSETRAYVTLQGEPGVSVLRLVP